MTAMQQKPVSAENLHEAIGRSVLQPTAGGYYRARGFEEFALANVSDRASMLGADAFTEVYFTTSSGNLYKIWRNEEREWILAEVRSNRGRGPRGKLLAHTFTPEQMSTGVLRVGGKFFYAQYYTTEIKAILAMNAGRVHLRPPTRMDLVTDIRNEFDRLISEPHR